MSVVTLSPPASFWPDAQTKRAFDRPFTIDRTHTIPYIAGYSRDGRTIYIDRDFPPRMMIADYTFDPEPFVVLHERVEKAFLDSRNIKYQTAHADYAVQAEHAALKAAGFTPKDIASYDGKMNALSKATAARPASKVPVDLDKTPYRDTKNMAVLSRSRAPLYVQRVTIH